MIDFSYQTKFRLEKSKEVATWISEIIISEGCSEGEINYIFCDDDYLFKLNKEFLNHDTLTDIISFDYSLGKELHGEIYISIDRVRDNAIKFEVDFGNELHRVIVHGILHYCGYRDKSEIDASTMRKKEDDALTARGFC